MTRDARPERPFAHLGLRLATAVVIGAIILGVAFYGRVVGLGVLIAVVAALAVAEFYRLTREEDRTPNEVFGLGAAATMPLAVAGGAWLADQTGESVRLYAMVGLSAVVTGLVVASLAWHVAFRQVKTADTATTVFGAIYVGFTLSHLVLMRTLDAGVELVLATLVSVWANDVFAYLVGTSIGRHRLAPKISPGKSWEGAIAGGLLTVLVWVSIYWIAPVGLSLGRLVAIGVAVSVAAVIGDLAESRLKREAGVKDSGTILPGHGGFLDRFDSLILVSVVAYYALLWAGAR